LNFSVCLFIQVCKFFCLNSDCKRRIFTERIPEIALPWARKTVRQIEHLQAIGLALGGAAGSRLGIRLGYASCGSTLLNHLQRFPLPEFETPKVLGVDDFAFRKGWQYGTILVNLETHQPITLLGDRKAETLADWLQEHPGVEVLSRDRSKTYKSAMDRAAPDAIQVADRFHLVKNLSETLELALEGYHPELKATEQLREQAAIADSSETVIVTQKPTATASAQERMRDNYQRRVEQHRSIKALCEQQWPQAAIAQKLGVSIRTVQRYLSRPDFPPTPSQQQAFGTSLLNPYRQKIVAWWNSGITQSNVLMLLLKREGYSGGLRTLQRYLSGFREAQGSPRVQPSHSRPKVVDPQFPPLTPRQIAYFIVLRPENRKPEGSELLELLVNQHPDLATLVDLAHEFLELLRQRRADIFDDWLMRALTCQIRPLRNFAAGLIDDYDAVKASMKLEVSNGQVEGFNNRLKMLKRQMYGRAGLALLTKRFIMAV
jgi:hypothetical protein